jgi:hypothetical protein
MDEKDRRRRESATALLTFLWGVQFSLVMLLLFGQTIRNAPRLAMGAGPSVPQVLSGLSSLAGALMGMWLFAGNAWKRLPRAWRLDAAFGYLALLPTSAFVLFATLSQGDYSRLACLCGGTPIALVYILIRVVPTLRRRGLDEEEFP